MKRSASQVDCFSITDEFISCSRTILVEPWSQIELESNSYPYYWLAVVISTHLTTQY